MLRKVFNMHRHRVAFLSPYFSIVSLRSSHFMFIHLLKMSRRRNTNKMRICVNIPSLTVSLFLADCVSKFFNMLHRKLFQLNTQIVKISALRDRNATTLITNNVTITNTPRAI